MIRLSCTLKGETFMYIYPPEESEQVIQMITLHVAEGRLHPTAGLLLAEMIVGENGAD